jgi:hypothetical protein
MNEFACFGPSKFADEVVGIKRLHVFIKLYFESLVNLNEEVGRGWPISAVLRWAFFRRSDEQERRV